jgi:hypothetical protein
MSAFNHLPKTNMKTKYFNKLNTWIASALVIGSLAGCTDKFDEFNDDPYGVNEEDLLSNFKNLGDPLKSAQLSVYCYTPAWVTQVQQNLSADIYSGYMMPPTPFAGGVNNSNYGLIDGWNEWVWNMGYASDFGSIMAPTETVINTTKDDYPEFYAWAKILRVEGMHRVSDVYGPIIYTKYGTINEDGSTSFDSQEEAYEAFFADLDEAIDILTPRAQSGDPSPFGDFDLVYGGSYTKWVKFANTLRLRLAIRISGANANLAKIEGEKSLANPIGLLTAVEDNFYVNIGAIPHPLNVFNNDWSDIRLGAPIGSILGGYDDPRLEKYAQPATDEAVAGEIIGIRNGVDLGPDKSRYAGFSKLATFESKVLLMTTAEAFFLKAEAALKGWTGAGTALAAYESGVKASFDQYALGGADTYLADDTSTPAEYVDPKSPVAGTNDVLDGNSHLSTITIKWDDGAPAAEKLERIITQKWIAMYPEGQEAWSEFRRTGYPKLFTVVINNSGGKISTEEFIKRLNFAQSEKNTNPIGVAGAVDLLDGPDTGGTPLWWDVD